MKDSESMEGMARQSTGDDHDQEDSEKMELPKRSIRSTVHLSSKDSAFSS